jgi:hypothetical protein
MRLHRVLTLVGVMLLPACAQQDNASLRMAKNVTREDSPSLAGQSGEQEPVAFGSLLHGSSVHGQNFVQMKDGEPAKGQVEPKKAEPVERKIRYTATMQIICEDFAKAEEGLKAAIKAHKGLIAHSEATGAPGAPRTGIWRVRLPIPEFDAFREAVLALGRAEKDSRDSEDLTDVYYDLENHIKNKLSEEEALRKLLEKSGGEKIENILAIRRELEAVRDDINRKQGRLKLIANLTELTTVTVTLREKQKYDPTPPPDIAETPTFGMRIDRTFTTSWEAFVSFLQFLVLAVIAAGHWVALGAVVGGVAYVIARRRARMPVVTEVVEPTSPPAS